MKKNALRIFGVILFLVGTFFILNSLRLSGFIVVEEVRREISSILGIVLVLVGIAIVVTQQRETTKSDLEITVRDLAKGKSSLNRRNYSYR